MLNYLDILILFLSGCIGGVLSGLLGVGGGIIYVVVLGYYLNQFGLDQIDIVKYIISNSAFAVFFAGVSGSIKQIRSRNYFFKEVIITAVPAIISSLLIVYLILYFDWYSKKRFSIFFIFMLTLFMYRMFKPNSGDSKFKEKDRIPLKRYTFVGFITGVFSALSGLGGGVVMVPVLAGFFKLKIKKVISISLGIMPFFTLSMTLFYAFSNNPPLKEIKGAIGYIIPSLVIPMSIGVILCSPLGIRISHRLLPRAIKIIFAIVLLLVITRMIYIYFH